MKRTIVFLHESDNSGKLIEQNSYYLLSNKLVDAVYVASSGMDNIILNNDAFKVENLTYPAECDIITKKRNWLNKHFKSQNYDGMLYVVEDNVKFNDVSTFFNKLENMMKLFDYSVWFNTIADPCNYLYKKYVPRVSINIDQPEYKALGVEQLLYTSHSNTALIAYNFSSATDDQLTFNENFEIPMYYIIEFLARRRNNKPANSLFFMNQYMTIPEEHGIFEIDNTIQTPKSDIKKRMATEDQIFKCLNINYAADNNIDQLLELTYEKLKSKLKI